MATPSAHAAIVTSAPTIGPSTWPSYLDGPSHTSYNAAATSINVSAVESGDLQTVWRWQVPRSTNAGTNSILASPTVVDGVMYIGAKDGMFYAVDEATQKILWSDFTGLDAATGSCGSTPQGVTSTASVNVTPSTGQLTVYIFGAEGDLYAIDAKTGAVVWQSIVDSPSKTTNDYYSWSSPLVVHGDVYVGISSDCDNPLIPGGLAEFNQSTGTEVARWYTLPPGDVGGSIWSSVAALSNGSILATTGNGYDSSGNPPYDESLVNLTSTAQHVLGAWSLPPSQQVTDSDFGASPTLFTATINGDTTPMVGACNKNGVYYALPQDDLTAGPLWQTVITIPYPGSYEECDAAAVWNGQDLIEGGGAPTSITGTSYLGSVQALTPDTGKQLWQTGVPGFVIGSPTEDGAGVVAVSFYNADTAADMGVYLLDASNGQIIDKISLPREFIFSQPVFANNDLLVAGNDQVIAYAVTEAGPAISKVSPNSVGLGTTTTVDLTGSGFSGTPKVFVSGTLVTASQVKVLSPTSLSFTLSVTKSALANARGITVIEPGSTPDVADTCEGCLTITGPTTTSLASTLNPSVYGQAVSFTATVSNGTATPPTGTVTFKEGSGTLGTEPLNSSGVAKFTVSKLPAGPQTITAVYDGDNVDPPSTSNNVTEAVNPALTSTSMVSESANPSTYGQPLHFVATTVERNGTGTPTGVVRFFDGSTYIGDAGLNKSGNASFTIASLPSGKNEITAIYPGSGNDAGSPAGPLEGSPSESNTIDQVVNPATTKTSLSSSANPSVPGESVTLTAIVSNGTHELPTGTVTFSRGSTVLGTETLNATGSATYSTSTLPDGTSAITAAYNGDANDNASTSSTLDQTVSNSKTSVTSTPNPSSVGQAITFTATVSSIDGGPTPTGTVTFTYVHSGKAIGTATLNSSGVASFDMKTPPKVSGTYEIVGTFSGNSDYIGGVSNIVKQTVT